MIAELVVTDLGVFAQAKVNFGPGLNALTGETGAGKSLVVGAIQLLLGARADSGVVRSGAAEAVVDGRFVDHDGEEIVLSRAIPADGRSRAYLNGRPITASELAEVGARLVDLHGQHGHQQLLRPATQRRVLDRFAGVDLGPLHTARDRIRDIDRALGELGGDERTRVREIDLLRYQLDELDGAAITNTGEDDDLDAEESVLADAVTHTERGAAASLALLDDGGVSDQLQSAIALIAGRAPFAEVEAQLQAAAAEISEAGADLRTAVESITDDPERLAAIRERRQLLADMRRKYGETLTEVIDEHRAIAERLAELEGYEERVAALTQDRKHAEKEWAEAAARIAAQRRRAAPKLAAAVATRLHDLAMPHAVFDVVAEGEDPGDDVRFLLAANPGSPPAPMERVASGGELSRATLALRLELTAGPPTLIFDEVDAGVGGEAAIAVATSLAALADRHQILVVTHLPQVAAFADRQLVVTKEAGESSTDAAVELLDPDARVAELARMLDGRPSSDVGRQHATELLNAASDTRSCAGK